MWTRAAHQPAFRGPGDKLPLGDGWGVSRGRSPQGRLKKPFVVRHL